MHSVQQRRGLGFTLIDTVLTIAILGFLVSLALPVIYSAQQNAERAACQVKLRELSMAVLRFESATGTLPPAGYVTHWNPNAICQPSYGASFNCYPISNGTYSQAVPMLSWIALCLPYMNQQALYDQFDFATGIRLQSPEAVSTVLPELICPSSPETAELFYDGSGGLSPVNGAGLLFAKGNYGAYISPVHIDHQAILPAALGNFALGSRFGQTLKSVTDGAGRTILAADIKAIPRDWDQRGAWVLPFPGVVMGLDLHPFSLNPSSSYVPDPSSASIAQVPNNYLNPEIGDALFTCNEEVWLRHVMRAPCVRINTYISAAPRSNHPGGVNVVTLDGRTSFIVDEVDPITYAYQISSNDGHEIVTRGR